MKKHVSLAALAAAILSVFSAHAGSINKENMSQHSLGSIRLNDQGVWEAELIPRQTERPLTRLTMDKGKLGPIFLNNKGEWEHATIPR
jgi:hypothetical protein